MCLGVLGAGNHSAGWRWEGAAISNNDLAVIQEIAAACKGVRPNHIGIAIARHKRAGRIEERDGKLYATHSIETEQHAAV